MKDGCGGNQRWRESKVAGIHGDGRHDENFEVGENLLLCEVLGRVTHRVLWCKGTRWRVGSDRWGVSVLEPKSRWE